MNCYNAQINVTGLISIAPGVEVGQMNVIYAIPGGP